MADEKSRGRGAQGRGGWWFLSAMLLLHLIVRWLDPALSEASMARFVATLTDLLPLFGLMFLLLWLFNLLLFSVLGGAAMERLEQPQACR